MRVFLTGATGFVGSAIVQELIHAGHQVLGLARSDKSAEALRAAGAQVHRGDLENLESLRSGVAASDGVIHTAFNHDFSKFQENCELDRRVIEALGSALVGTHRPLIITSGTGLLSPGQISTENSMPSFGPDAFPRVISEKTANLIAERGVRVSVVRLPPTVHGDGDHGFVPALIKIAREKGESAYVDQGHNRWSAVHVLDAARLYRLVLEKGIQGARYHAVAEEGVPFHDIAKAISRGLNVRLVAKTSEEATQHFGWFAHFARIDAPSSSKLTQESLNWRPVQSSLLTDLKQGKYFKS